MLFRSSFQPTQPLQPTQPNPSIQLNPPTQPVPPFQSTPRAPIPESVTRRPPLIGRIAVIVLAVAGVIMIGLGIGLAVSGEMGGFAACTVMGLILVAILPFGLRPRVILDARGIHVRSVFLHILFLLLREAATLEPLSDVIFLFCEALV